MSAEFSRRLFLLAAPGAEGFTAFRPLWARVLKAEAAYAEENLLRRRLTLSCPPDSAVSPGDALFAPDSPSLSEPGWLILSVRRFSRHIEAQAEAFPP